MKKLLIIGFVWPEPATTAAGGRMMQLLQHFLDQDYKITFASTAARTNYSVDLEKLGISIKKIALNSDSFDIFISNLDPGLVLFDRFLTEEQFGWRVAEHAPNAIRILDTEDLHFLRKERELAHKQNRKICPHDLLNSDHAIREIASIYRCDLSLIISDYEMQLLQTVFKVDKSILLHLPFMLDRVGEVQLAQWPTYEERSNFICIGNGKHAPNVDALVWIKKEIWPTIRKKLPNSELHIYGAYLPIQVKEMHNPKDGFLVKGWAKDVDEVLAKARIILAPLRFGAGIKGKLISAIQNGTPSVTTTIGAEGMHQDMPWSGTIDDTTSEIINSAIALYTDKKAWQKAQQNGVRILNSVYSKNEMNNRLLLRIKQISKDVIAHRNNNFVGKMLQHHTMGSTKYLSKYIAEKNKD